MRLGWALLAALALTACTGTFTPAAPTLYLVFLDADAATSRPPRVALLTFEATPSERRLGLLTASAYEFAAAEVVLAVDVLDRDDRSEAWVLTADGGASRAVSLHRIDLRSVPDLPGTTLAAAAPVRRLTDADGAWVGLDAASGMPTGCLAALVVQPSGRRLALWDAGSGARCGAPNDDPGPRVHVLDLEVDSVATLTAEVVAPGVRAADPSDASGLLLVRRPPVGDLDDREVVAVSFASPEPDLGARGTAVDGLLDVAGIPGGIAALRATTGGDRAIAVTVGEVTSQRDAPTGATAIHADPSGRLTNLLTTGGGRLGVTYPGEATMRELAFDARALTIEPLNAYALAVRGSGGLCLVDLLVPSTSTACDLALDPAVVAALPNPRFVTWTYAEPAAP